MAAPAAPAAWTSIPKPAMIAGHLIAWKIARKPLADPPSRRNTLERLPDRRSS
jgi:hypothetical protein